MICLPPVVRDDPGATLTQEVFEEHVQAMVLVRHELGRRARFSMLGRVVVVIVHLLAHLVQAVDEVEDLDLREVAVGT